MALRDIYKQIEKAEKEAEERKHILLKLHADRNVCDAYLQGLVFAAYANDDAGIVDGQERDLLRCIGEAFGYQAGEVDLTISRIGALGVKEKMGLIADCVGSFDCSELMEAFVAEFSRVWFVGGGTSKMFGDFLKDFESWASPEIGQALKARRIKGEEEQERVRQEAEWVAAEERKKLEKVRADAFYDIANAMIGQSEFSSTLLVGVRKQLEENKFDSLNTGEVWVAIYREYKKRLEKNAGASTKIGNLSGAATLGGAAAAVLTGLTAFPATVVGAAVYEGVTYFKNKSAAEAIVIAARCSLVKALVCLCALKCQIDDVDITNFNELYRKAVNNNPLPKSPDGTDGFWYFEVEPRLCARLNVGRIVLAG